MLLVREGRKDIVEKPTLANSQYGIVTDVVADRAEVKIENNKGKFLQN